ncbi:hypothetical protein BCL80_11467 [Streptomyces avidinii]|nr:hypothetical protein BCL80_11467 [Streptomyces avidinii]
MAGTVAQRSGLAARRWLPTFTDSSLVRSCRSIPWKTVAQEAGPDFRPLTPGESSRVERKQICAYVRVPSLHLERELVHVLRKASAAAAATLAALTLGSCSPSGPSSPGVTTGEAHVDKSRWPKDVPDSGLTKGLALPLESYMVPYSDQVVIDSALRDLQTECMSTYGFTVNLPRPGVHPPASSNSMNIERRYGITDRAEAEKYGYLLSPEQQKYTAQQTPDLPGIQVEVLTGHTRPEPVEAPVGSDVGYSGVGENTKPARAEYKGRKLHKDGCAGWSKRQLELNESDAGFVTQLASTGLSETRPHKSVEQAVKRWSACMKDKGRKASDPYRAMEQGLVETDTQDSIALALDDIDCKEQTRLIEVWFKEESAVQKRLIKENKDQLDVVKTRTRDVLTAAKAVK